MRKKTVKLTEAELLRIKELYQSGKTLEQMRKALKVPTNLIRYHVERIILATINDPALAPEVRHSKGQEAKREPIPNESFYTSVIKELQAKNKALFDLYNGTVSH
jgi:hypothetical protein